MYNKFYVITDGPGAGKTTLITELKTRGYRCLPEAARQIIREQVKSGGDAVPWNNIKRFKEMLFAHTIETYKRAIENSEEVTFFDRGVLDLIAYDRRTKTESSQDLHQAVQSLLYNKKVFIAPPWKEIFCNDSERKQTYEEAVEVYTSLVQVYTDYECELIELPKTTLPNRITFITQHIQSIS